MTPPTKGPALSAEERSLGMDRSITRRDFVNATLAGSGFALLGGRPRLAQSDPATAFNGFGGVGDYARSHGNMWEMIETAHAMRDGKFGSRLSSAVDTGERYDLIVVGGGFSGLGAAHRFRSGGGQTLVLDNHPIFGGEAKRNEFRIGRVRLLGPQGSNGFGLPTYMKTRSDDWHTRLWKEIGLPTDDSDFRHQAWAPGITPIEMPRDHYYFQLWSDEFDTHGFYFPDGKGGLRLVKDAFRHGLSQTPWSDSLRRDFIRWRTDPKRYYEGKDWQQWLDTMTYEDYLVKVMGLDVAVARYVDPIMAAAIGLGSDVLSAYAAHQIRLPGFQGFTGTTPSRELATQKMVSSFPGGNDGIMRHLIKSLIPASIQGGATFGEIQNGRIDFAMLDHPQNQVRVRVGATVIHVSPGDRGGDVTVTYVVGGKLYRTRAANVIMASGGWSTKHVVEGLPAEYHEAYEWFVRAPMLVVNVALAQWRPLYRNHLTAASYRDQIGFSCNLRRSVVMDGYQPLLHPDRPTLLTFYIPFSAPGSSLEAQAVQGRTRLLATSYRDYERQIRQQIGRLFGRFGLDPARDIAGVILNRWGHAYVCPAPGFYSERDGKPAPPDRIRRPFGRIAFANAELHGHQNYYDALLEGRRAAEQVLASRPGVGGGE